MATAQLLDCTLRDGGFINKWHFGKNSIENISFGLLSTGIDYLELGYLRNGVQYSKDITEFSSTADAQWLVKIKNSIPDCKAQFTLLLDYGSCDIKNLLPRTDDDVDCIRVTFKKNEIESAVDFCRQVKALGYQVSAQPVAITDYSDSEILALLQMMNTLAPYCVSMVDTYGMMVQNDVLHLFSMMDRNLAEGILVGYHAHNNFQLGFSNAVAMLNHNTTRRIVIDTSLYGMGKSAGNICTELLMHHINVSMPGRYEQETAMELIDMEISKYQKEGNWGYGFAYYMAAAYRCHPQYVFALTRMKSLSVHSIAAILSGIPAEKKTRYDERYILEAYRVFQMDHTWDDSGSYRALAERMRNRCVLVVGLGNSANTYCRKIESFIADRAPFVIGVNGQLGQIEYDALFFKNEKRFWQYGNSVEEGSTQPTLLYAGGQFKLLNRKALGFCIANARPLAEALDNSTNILLYILLQCGARSVYVAGIDGFRPATANFAPEYHSMGKNEEDYDEINRKAQVCLDDLEAKGMTIVSVTPPVHLSFGGSSFD